MLRNMKTTSTERGARRRARLREAGLCYACKQPLPKTEPLTVRMNQRGEIETIERVKPTRVQTQQKDDDPFNSLVSGDDDD